VDFDLREVGAQEESLVLTFLYLAARMPDSGEPIQKALADPFLKKYWTGWGRPGDFGILAVERSSGMPISCAWVRQFSRHETPETFVGADVPELGIGTVDGYRGQGVGAAVLRALVEAGRGRCRGICLSVRADNPAVSLYERLGFRRIHGSDASNRIGTRSFSMLLAF
jgi:GNAT superfamily N-acetyltransferase